MLGVLPFWGGINAEECDFEFSKDTVVSEPSIWSNPSLSDTVFVISKSQTEVVFDSIHIIPNNDIEEARASFSVGSEEPDYQFFQIEVLFPKESKYYLGRNKLSLKPGYSLQFQYVACQYRTLNRLQ